MKEAKRGLHTQSSEPAEEIKNNNKKKENIKKALRLHIKGRDPHDRNKFILEAAFIFQAATVKTMAAAATAAAAAEG